MAPSCSVLLLLLPIALVRGPWSVVRGLSPGFVGALWEPCGRIRDALGWLCRRFGVALGSQSVGYQHALGSH